MTTGPCWSCATAPRPCWIEIESTRASSRAGAAPATATRSRVGPSGTRAPGGSAATRTAGRPLGAFEPSSTVPSGATATERAGLTSRATARFSTISIFRPCGKSGCTESECTVGSSATASWSASASTCRVVICLAASVSFARTREPSGVEETPLKLTRSTRTSEESRSQNM